MPTAGWIIFTSAARLIDGSNLRLPTDRILDHSGKDMELHPRAVDVEVQDPPDTWRQDPQLEAAVKALMAQIQTPADAAIAAGGGGK